jgi:hypothetical protein
VLDYIAERGEHGATAEEVSLDTGIRMATVAARVNELWSGYRAITDTGERRPTTSGRAATVWAAINSTTPEPASVAGHQTTLFETEGYH